MKETEKIQVTILNNGIRSSWQIESGKGLFQVLQEQGVLPSSFSHCGGKGICGRCKVRFLEGAPLPSTGDRIVFNPEELRKGFRLACHVKLDRDCRIQPFFLEQEQNAQKKIAVVTSMWEGMERKEGEATCIAIDLGTTTIAMELKGIETNLTYDTFCTINPQRIYGTDVISRIQASNQGNGDKLKQLVWKALEEGMKQLLKKVEEIKLCKPRKAYLAGNTAMVQLFMGYSVAHMGTSPFLPENIQMQTVDVLGIPTTIMPGISAFVGGDIVAGLYYVKKQQGGFCSKKYTLFIDLGTNGEIAIGNRDRIFTTATAAGPAFEGGSGSSIMGADLIDCLAELRHQEILDETGLLKEPWFETGAHVNGTVIMQKDVRALQVAKAAVFAGINTLIEISGISTNQIEQVYLAGGFGYFLNVNSALEIGLIPMELQSNIKAVGNTSLAGAFAYGKEENKEELKQLVKRCEYLNLAEEERFQKGFTEVMELKSLYYKK